ncbi:DUF805 domain-containing protein [Arthrobacter sedimenti]|uniref:DUF805 domain-containing protein n=1 Tax=Arthrobacter sedimenti TaxID=2694931 RepID=UPI000B359835|nr:hypothetical protein B8W73_07455 [Arthrobacter agilis]
MAGKPRPERAPIAPLFSSVSTYSQPSNLIAGLWLIVTIVPGFTIAIRPLHASNLSGCWVLLALVPSGAFILLLLAIRRPRPEGARFDI